MATRHNDEWELPDEVPGDHHSSQEARSWEKGLSDTPRRRKEASLKSKFLQGDELYHVRQQAILIREELQQARTYGATRRVQQLEQAILQIQQVDAEFVYAVNLERMEMAQQQGRLDDYERYKKDAMEARSALPQYNLDGLWVGK